MWAAALIANLNFHLDLLATLDVLTPFLFLLIQIQPLFWIQLKYSNFKSKKKEKKS